MQVGTPRLFNKRDDDWLTVLVGASHQVFGRRRKMLALAAIAAGVVVLFVPLVTTDPPVVGKAQWSIFDVVFHIYQKKLPPSSDWSAGYVDLPYAIAIVYLLLLAAAAVLCFPNLHRKLPPIALFAMYIAGEMWKRDKNSFEMMFYGTNSYHNLSLVRHVGFGQLVIVLVVVTGALLYIAMDKELDVCPTPATEP
jgi:hypothetical protein